MFLITELSTRHNYTPASVYFNYFNFCILSFKLKLTKASNKIKYRAPLMRIQQSQFQMYNKSKQSCRINPDQGGQWIMTLRAGQVKNLAEKLQYSPERLKGGSQAGLPGRWGDFRAGVSQWRKPSPWGSSTALLQGGVVGFNNCCT